MSTRDQQDLPETSARNDGLRSAPAGLKPGVKRADPKRESHWLSRPETVRRLWWVFGAVLTLMILAQAVIPVKGNFGLESSFAFGAWFGFGSCVAMVLAAKVLGRWLKRPDDYYCEDEAGPRLDLPEEGQGDA